MNIPNPHQPSPWGRRGHDSDQPIYGGTYRPLYGTNPSADDAGISYRPEGLPRTTSGMGTPQPDPDKWSKRGPFLVPPRPKWYPNENPYIMPSPTPPPPPPDDDKWKDNPGGGSGVRRTPKPSKPSGGASRSRPSNNKEKAPA